MIRGHVYLNRAGVDLIRVGMETIRGHVGWNRSGATDDRPPTTDDHAWIRASVVRLPSAVCRLSSYV
jgi:hypothetical protein